MGYLKATILDNVSNPHENLFSKKTAPDELAFFVKLMNSNYEKKAHLNGKNFPSRCANLLDH